jgi:hypothetical protein
MPSSTSRCGIDFARTGAGRYSGLVRLTAPQRLLAAALAIWMPLSCCCQAMALARTAVAAVSATAGADETGDCAAASCCSAREPAVEHRTSDEPGDERSTPPCDQCPACASAKSKAPPPSIPDIDHDEVGRDIDWLGASATDREAMALRIDRRAWSGADPPWRPAGRCALARHARLLI